MEKKPLISVVIPTYNAEKYIGETLKSILEQTYENWECIIVNDGSTDNTLSVVNQWLEKDSRFSVLNKKNGGLSRARNSGTEAAKGDYVAFIDNDDIWLPHHLSSLMEKMMEYEVDLVFSYAYKMIDKKGIYTDVCIMGPLDTLPNRIYQGREDIEKLLKGNIISPSFVLCNKESLVRNGGFDYYKKAEDIHTWIKLLCNGCKFYSIAKATGYYRVVEGSMSSMDRRCSREVLEIISIFKDKIISLGIDYYHYIKYWARVYFLIKNDKEHYVSAINYIYSIEKKYFSIFRHIAPFLPRRILKLLVLIRLKV